MGISEPLLLANPCGIESSENTNTNTKLQLPKYSPIPMGLNQVVDKLASRRTISRWIGSREQDLCQSQKLALGCFEFNMKISERISLESIERFLSPRLLVSNSSA